MSWIFRYTLWCCHYIHEGDHIHCFHNLPAVLVGELNFQIYTLSLSLRSCRRSYSAVFIICLLFRWVSWISRCTLCRCPWSSSCTATRNRRRVTKYTSMIYDYTVYLAIINAKHPCIFYIIFEARGESRKKLPHRANDLPHHPPVLYSNLPNDHCHFDEV